MSHHPKDETLYRNRNGHRCSVRIKYGDAVNERYESIDDALSAPKRAVPVGARIICKFRGERAKLDHFQLAGKTVVGWLLNF